MTEKAQMDRWEQAMESDGIIVGSDGSVRFTSKHKDELRRYFAMAGIDINNVRTKADYLAARREASPHFEEWLANTMETKEQTLERQLLIATLRGDDAEAARIKTRLRTKQT